MLKNNMQQETQYSHRLYGGMMTDCRYTTFLDGPTVLSRQFPGAQNTVSQLLSATGWTLNSWGGTWAGGFTSSSQSTSLINSLAITNGYTYNISLTTSSVTAGSFTVTMGGQTSPVYSANGSYIWTPTTASTAALTLVASSFTGTVLITMTQSTNTGSVDPITASGLTQGGIYGIQPVVSPGGMIGPASGTVSLVGNLSYINHLTTPASVTATDLGTGIGPSGYLMTVSWSNAASYGPADLMYVYRDSDALLAIGLASSGSTIVDGLSNVSYSVYCKATFNGTTFSSASSPLSSAIPSGSNVNLPSAANVLLGVPVGATTGTLDVGGVVLAKQVESEGSGLTVKQILQLLAAIDLGTTSVAGTTVTFKDSTGTNTRVVATMSGSQRTSITTTTSP